MRKTLLFFFAFIFLTNCVNGQKPLTGKEIYLNNRNAVVQIYQGDDFSGTGFIVSADGLVITANHVVATRESGFREYSPNVSVLVSGREKPYPAKYVADRISEDQRNYDFALLKITASGLPYVKLGGWGETDIGDEITIIPSLPGFGTMMLRGIVANKTAFLTELGPKPVRMILFQSPVRNGFSGSPIFSPKGRVVGIVNTKAFGIAPALDKLRSQWESGRSSGARVYITGGDVSASFIELINNLDRNLISGLGTGVDIGYATATEKNASKNEK